MSESANQIRLGDLLTKAGLLKPEDLREGMLIAKQQSLPVGRVLIMAEFISEPNLQAAVQAQSMIKDGQLDLDTALEALKLSASSQISLDEALKKHGWKDKTSSVSNKLGELLVEAGVISESQLTQALEQCQMSGFPLGRILVVMGFMAEQLLSSALNAQILIRDSKISRDQAIQGLRACHDRQISFEQSLKESGLQLPAGDTVRLGELLVMAQLLLPENLMQAIELGLTESKPIGQVLVENKLLTQDLLELALKVQRLVAEGKVKRAQCGEVLALANKESLSIEKAIEKLEPPKATPIQALPLYQFLQLAGLITAKDIEEALKQGSRNTELMGKMLMLTGAIDDNSLAAAVRLNDMVSQGILKPEQAILAMGLCQNRQCSVEQAFKSLGWGMALNQVTSQETIPPVSMAAGLAAQAVQAGAQTGQHPAAMATGQHPQYTSGQHDAMATGQHSQYTTGQHAAMATGQHPQYTTGQHAAQSTGQPDASGQFSTQTTSGSRYEAVEAHGDTSNQTATSDVPILDRNMFLQQQETAAESSDNDESQDVSNDEDGSKKKGGGKKRLADLMP